MAELHLDAIGKRMPQVGEKLLNQATVVAIRNLGWGEGVALCLTNGQASHKYVVWRIDAEWNAYSGFYTDSISAAVHELNERSA
jgi:hypothetical protein